MYKKQNDKRDSSRNTDQNPLVDRRKIAKRLRLFFMIRHIWIYPVCIFLVYYLSDAFIPISSLRIGIAIILAIFPFQSVVSLLYGKRNTLLRSQSKVLFQSLCTLVSGGYSLESAFMLSRPTLEKAFGKRSLMSLALHRLEKSLSAHTSLSEVLNDFCLRLDYVEILPVMHALSITKIVGNGVISILRNSCQMMSELIAVQSEVDANNSGRNAEALILCLMPFGITFSLSTFTQGYMSDARNSVFGIAMMLFAFTLSVVSCGLLLRIIADENKHFRNDIASIEKVLLPETFVSAIQVRLTQILPESFLTRQFELYSEISSQPHKVFKHQICKSLLAICLSCPVFLLIIHIWDYPLYFIVPAEIAMLFFVHHDLKRKVLQRRDTLMEEMPLFLSMLVTLLHSGVMLPKAIETCANAFDQDSTLGSEIKIMRAQMLSGLSAGNAIESLSSRTPIPEAQSALLLASRYEISGGAEVLQLLSLQSNACWSLCRNAARKKRERDALAMTLPMMLDFVSVLIVAITPAVLSLKLN